VEYCQGREWFNPPIPSRDAGKPLDSGDAKADGKPLDSSGATADGEPFDSPLFASDTDMSEETLHLSASTGGPSLTVKTRVKNKHADGKKKKIKTKHR
jgi:hypothetical protein